MKARVFSSVNIGKLYIRSKNTGIKKVTVKTLSKILWVLNKCSGVKVDINTLMRFSYWLHTAANQKCQTRSFRIIQWKTRLKKKPLVLWLFLLCGLQRRFSHSEPEVVQSKFALVGLHVQELAQSLLNQICCWESWKKHPDTLPESRWAYLTHLLPHPEERARDTRQERTVYALQRKGCNAVSSTSLPESSWLMMLLWLTLSHGRCSVKNSVTH